MGSKNQSLQYAMQASAIVYEGVTVAVPKAQCPTCYGAGWVFAQSGRRGPATARTHCPRGHEYTAENIYSRPGTNWRECKQCKRDYAERARGGSAIGVRKYMPGGVQ